MIALILNSFLLTTQDRFRDFYNSLTMLPENFRAKGRLLRGIARSGLTQPTEFLKRYRKPFQGLTTLVLLALGAAAAYNPAPQDRMADAVRTAGSVADITPAAGVTKSTISVPGPVSSAHAAAPAQSAKTAVTADQNAALPGLAEPVAPPPPEPIAVERAVTAKPSDTFMKLLRRAGAGRAESHDAIAAMRPVFNPRHLKKGQVITVMFLPADSDGNAKRLLAFAFEDGTKRVIWIGRGATGDFSTTVLTRKLTRRVSRFSGTITSSLYRAGTGAGLSPATLTGLIRLYSWDVDFQRDIQPGDSFDVMVEKFYNKDDELVRTGDIVYAELTLGGVNHPLYRFEAGKGRTSYFDNKGRSARKALMKTPIDGARLSSRYGRRRHPILRYNAMHRGIDFSAPRHTPIYAAGNGIIVQRGRKGAYGRYIRIRHNSRYSTAYAHMHRYAKGLRRGSRVRQGQVIGYVGSSGRSTGPHLHYEILVNGRQVNPLKVRLPSGRRLTGHDLRRFRKTLTDIDTSRAELKPAVKITRR